MNLERLNIVRSSAPDLNSMKTISVIGLSALSFLLVLGFLPVGGAVSGSNSTKLSNGCTITWTNPSGTYSPGSAIDFTVSTACAGSGLWLLSSQTSGSLVASGSFMCGSSGCTNTATLTCTAGSAPCTPGTYLYTALFNGAKFSFSFTVSQFMVTNELPAGILLGVLAPVAGVFGYSKLKKLHV
jgi:hypothetical protein